MIKLTGYIFVSAYTKSVVGLNKNKNLITKQDFLILCFINCALNTIMVLALDIYRTSPVIFHSYLLHKFVLIKTTYHETTGFLVQNK